MDWLIAVKLQAISLAGNDVGNVANGHRFSAGKCCRTMGVERCTSCFPHTNQCRMIFVEDALRPVTINCSNRRRKMQEAEGSNPAGRNRHINIRSLQNSPRPELLTSKLTRKDEEATELFWRYPLKTEIRSSITCEREHTLNQHCKNFRYNAT